jgi:hypothetical protein
MRRPALILVLGPVAYLVQPFLAPKLARRLRIIADDLVRHPVPALLWIVMVPEGKQNLRESNQLTTTAPT